MKRTALVASLIALALCSGVALAQGDEAWIGTWASSPTGLPTVSKIGSYAIPAPTVFKGTIRYRIRISHGGNRLRLRLSNEYGSAPLVLSAVTVGIAANGADAQPGSLKKATFGGTPGIIIPAGAPALTDAIDLAAKPLADLLVSVYVKEGMPAFAWSAEASPTDPATATDTDATLMERFPSTKRMGLRPIVSGVSVLTDRPTRVVVTLGDSITDGGTDAATGERGWPGALARRVQGQNISVVNAGIGGNRVLQPLDIMGRAALSRLEQDALSVPGITHLVVLEGINDIGMSGPGSMLGDVPLVTAEELIAGYLQIVVRARERGIKVIGATILPFEGASYFSEEKEKVRAAVNAWIRTAKAFDGVIDFDEALRDPAQPRKLKAEYDTGDRLHPNPVGYRKMGDAVDFSLFKN